MSIESSLGRGSESIERRTASWGGKERRLRAQVAGGQRRATRRASLRPRSVGNEKRRGWRCRVDGWEMSIATEVEWPLRLLARNGDSGGACAGIRDIQR